MNCILDFFRKKRHPLRALFPKATDEQWARILQDLERPVDFTKRQMTVHYVLCIVNEEPMSELEGRMTEITRILKSHEAYPTIVPPLLLATLGWPGEQRSDLGAKMTAAVDGVMKAMPSDAKLIYGSPTAYYGPLEYSNVGLVGAIFPRMEERLRRLLNLKFGETLRMD